MNNSNTLRKTLQGVAVWTGVWAKRCPAGAAQILTKYRINLEAIPAFIKTTLS